MEKLLRFKAIEYHSEVTLLCKKRKNLHYPVVSIALFPGNRQKINPMNKAYIPEIFLQ